MFANRYHQLFTRELSNKMNLEFQGIVLFLVMAFALHLLQLYLERILKQKRETIGKMTNLQKGFLEIFEMRVKIVGWGKWVLIGLSIFVLGRIIFKY